MHADKQNQGGRIVRSVTYLSVAVNIALSAIKLAVGLLSGSLALMADGVHSLSDLATDGAVLVGVHFGSKGPDQCHPYGHGRLETFAAVAVALVLVVVGGAMIYRATMSIACDQVTTFHAGVLAVAVLSIAAKEWLYRLTRRAAVKSHSSALYANAWHHRSDALSSVAVVIGVVSLAFGFTHGDQVAAIAVGLMIVWVGVKTICDSARELAESAVDSETVERVKQIIESDTSIRRWHKLRTRMVGREIFLDLHILVDPALNVEAAHAIAERLENAVDEQLSRPVNIIVHVEPDIPELRK